MARVRSRTQLPAPQEKVAAVDAMFDTIAPRYESFEEAWAGGKVAA